VPLSPSSIIWYQPIEKTFLFQRQLRQ